MPVLRGSWRLNALKKHDVWIRPEVRDNVLRAVSGRPPARGFCYRSANLQSDQFERNQFRLGPLYGLHRKKTARREASSVSPIPKPAPMRLLMLSRLTS